jgi:hypothetical protein
MVTQCPWCERYHLFGQWLHNCPPGHTITHGICPDCHAEMRATLNSQLK